MPSSFLEYPVYFWQLFSGFRTTHENMYADLRRQDTSPFLRKRVPLRILDLGNGRLRPQYSLLKACGHSVYGIDLVNRPETSILNALYRVARCLYAWKSAVPSRSLVDETLICGDVATLPFHSNSFDLVTSVAAFEHFLDVRTVIEEVKRVLRAGGLVWACIHLFTCPSGGHNVTFTQIPLVKMPPGTDAWDHLRRRYVPITVPLNEWRRNQYLHLFAEHFQVIKHYCAVREGVDFLTPSIAAELSNYTADELTCHAYVILARKIQ